jgi:hypothetical protein
MLYGKLTFEAIVETMNEVSEGIYDVYFPSKYMVRFLP